MNSKIYTISLSLINLFLAVMFLFEGDFGRVLHTGDFRYDADELRDVLALSGTLDCLIVDNTYGYKSCTVDYLYTKVSVLKV